MAVSRSTARSLACARSETLASGSLKCRISVAISSSTENCALSKARATVSAR